MNCPKCQGRMIYEPPSFPGDQGSARCLICGNRIWEPAKVVMPKAERPATTVPAGEEHLSKEREKYLAGLKELADLDGDYFQVSF